jgi:hypothetical protein
MQLNLNGGKLEQQKNNIEEIHRLQIEKTFQDRCLTTPARRAVRPLLRLLVPLPPPPTTLPTRRGG